MKPCQNCRVIYADDYMGTCHECGAPMGSQSANQGLGDLSFRYARQVQDSSRENAEEQAMKRGRYDGVKIPDGIMEVARRFVVVDHEKLRQLEAQNGN